MANMRTLAFQVPEDLFQKIKDYLRRNNITQKEFVIGLIESEIERDLTAKEAQDKDSQIDEAEEDEDEYLNEYEDELEDETEDEYLGEDEEIEETDEDAEFGEDDADEFNDESEYDEDEEETEGMSMGM